MKIVTLCGSPRPNSQTANALAIVIDELRASGAEVVALSVAEMTLSFPGSPETADAVTMQTALRSADGIILSTPEYHGGVSSALKQAIENIGFPSALKGKPLALLGVAAGVIGAIKSLEQLRGICAHTGALVLPGAASIAQVNKQFDEDGHCTDPGTEKRLRELAKSLTDFIGKHTCPEQSSEASVRAKSP